MSTAFVSLCPSILVRFSGPQTFFQLENRKIFSLKFPFYYIETRAPNSTAFVSVCLSILVRFPGLQYTKPVVYTGKSKIFPQYTTGLEQDSGNLTSLLFKSILQSSSQELFIATLHFLFLYHNYFPLTYNYKPCESLDVMIYPNYGVCSHYYLYRKVYILQELL